MAPTRRASKKNATNTRAQSNPHTSYEDENRTRTPITQRHTHTVDTTRDVPIARSHRNSIDQNVPRITSHTEPRFLEASVRRWTQRQALTKKYDVHKRATRIDPIAKQAASNMSISRFVQPVTYPSPIPSNTSGTSPRSLFHAGHPPEDLNHSLRNFVVADPVQNANVVCTRIAIKEGRTMAGYVPALPQPRRRMESEENFTSDLADDPRC